MEHVFHVAVRGTGATKVVAVTGELDVATAPEVGRVLAQLSGRVVVDCSSLRFMDASALGTFVRASRHLESLRLVNVAPFIRKIVELVELDTVLLGSDPEAARAEPVPADESDVPTPPPMSKAGE